MKRDDDMPKSLKVFGGLLWAAIALLLLGWLFGFAAYSKGVGELHLTRVQKNEIEVVDGDTIRIGRSSYRLMGFDTPETTMAKCESERVAGDAAALRLSELILLSKIVEMDYRGKDKYKRTLAMLYVDGKDVASILVMEGHAVPYNGRTKRRSWCD